MSDEISRLRQRLDLINAYAGTFNSDEARRIEEMSREPLEWESDGSETGNPSRFQQILDLLAFDKSKKPVQYNLLSAMQLYAISTRDAELEQQCAARMAAIKSDIKPL